MSKTTAWIILGAIVVVLAAGGYYFLAQENGNTNSSNAVTVTNTMANENVNGSMNANTELNTNTTSNTNEVTNTNTEVDTSDWLTYTNSEYGYTMQYPSDWTVEEVKLSEDPDSRGRIPPLRAVKFRNENKRFLLVMYLKPITELGTPYMSASPAWDQSEFKIQVGQYTISAIKETSEGRIQTIYIPGPSQLVQLGSYDFAAYLIDYSDNDARDLSKNNEYYVILEILKTLNI